MGDCYDIMIVGDVVQCLLFLNKKNKILKWL